MISWAARRVPLTLAAFVVAVVTALVLGALTVVTPVPAAQADTPVPAHLINPAVIDPNTNNPGLYTAQNSAQVASLDAFETEAVQQALALHQLPAGDADAMQTWGQTVAQYELWNLVLAAMQTDPSKRTADQQNVVDWMTEVQHRINVSAADNAGLEYTKWAGLGASNYQNLLASGATDAQLRAFFSQNPNNYYPTSGPNKGGPSQPQSTANEGYCTYTPPDPFGAQYSSNVYGGTAPTICYTPCPLQGCNTPYPSFDELVQWGLADTANATYNSAGLSGVTQSLIENGIFAGVATGGVLVGASIGKAVATAISDYYYEAMSVLDEGPWTDTQLLALDLSSGLRAVGGAAGAAGLVAIVVLAITAIVLASIQLAANLALPGQLADLITGAPGQTPDMHALSNDAGQAAGLLALFSGALLPIPDPSAGCTSGGTLPVQGTVVAPECLNAPPIPAPSANDTTFTVEQNGSSTGTSAQSFTVFDKSANKSTTVRSFENWFVESTDGAATQDLSLVYTDWNGVQKRAWLVGTGASGRAFLIYDDNASAPTDPNTCVQAGTCSASTSLQYVDADGNDYSATLPPGTGKPELNTTYRADFESVVALSTSTGQAQAGKPVTLSALVDGPTVGPDGQIIVQLAPPAFAGTMEFDDVYDGTVTTLCTDTMTDVYEPATCSWTPDASQVGDHVIYATFDGSQGAAITTPDGQTSSIVYSGPAQDSTAVTVATSDVTTTALAVSSVGDLSDPVTLTATIRNLYQGGAPPTGTVTFQGGLPACANVPTQATGDPDVWQATCTTSPLATGPNTFSATYTGPATDPGNSTASAVAHVTRAGDVVSLSYDEAMTVGQPNTVHVQLSAPGVAASGFNAANGVLVVDGSSVLDSCSTTGCTPLGTNCTAIVNATATCTVTPNAAGVFGFQIDYYDYNDGASFGSGFLTGTVVTAGGAALALSSDAMLTSDQVGDCGLVGCWATTTSVSASTAPSVGSPATMTANVLTVNHNPMGQGTVSFYAKTADGSQELCAAVPVIDSQDASTPYVAAASCTTTFEAPGLYDVVAVYSGGPASADPASLTQLLGSFGDETVAVNRADVVAASVDPLAYVGVATGVRVQVSSPGVDPSAFDATAGTVSLTGPNVGSPSCTPLTAGVASCTFTPLAAGAADVEVDFADATGSHQDATSGAWVPGQLVTSSVTTTVLPAAVVPLQVPSANCAGVLDCISTSASLAILPQHPQPKANVALTATLSTGDGSAWIANDGRIAFYAALDGSPATLAQLCGPMSLNPPAGSNATATCVAPFPSAGSYRVYAVYSGSDDVAPGVVYDGTVGQQVFQIGQPSVTTVTPADSTQQDGQTVLYTATVTDSAGLVPTGTVTFQTDDAVGTHDVCDAVALTASAPYTATCSITFSLPGQQVTVVGVYNGDGDLSWSQGQVPVFVPSVASSIGLSAAPTQPLLGQDVTFTAVVSNDAGVTPGGTVTFTDGSTTVCDSVALTLTGSSYTASCVEHIDSTGDHQVTAQYVGDLATQEASVSLDVDVAQAQTATALAASPTQPAVGQQVTYTATVSGPAGVTPGGTVTFADGSTSLCANVALPTTAPFTANCATTYAATGNHTITATYSGDAGTTTSRVSLQVSVGKAISTTALTVSPLSPVVGQKVSYTAVVTGAPALTGTVTFTDGATTICKNVPTTKSAPFTATCSQTYQAAGTHTIVASYSGAGLVAGSSGSVQVSVGKVVTSTTLTSSPSQPQYGQAITLTAAVVTSGTGPAITGTVTFSVDGQQVGQAVKVSGGKAVSAKVTGLAPGSHSASAVYSGDTAHAGSSSTLAESVGCTQTITGAHNGSLTVTGATCVQSGGSINGAITVRPGGYLQLTGATVHGAVTVLGAGGVLVCGSTITGAVSIGDVNGPMTFGGAGCAADQITGPLTVLGGSGAFGLAGAHVTGPVSVVGAAAVSITGATITGPLTISNNRGTISVTSDTIHGALTVTGNNGALSVGGNTVTGPVTVAGNRSPAAATITANTVTGSLSCAANNPTPSDAGKVNTVSGSATGQCASLAKH